MYYDPRQIMEINGLKCTVNTPAALVSRGSGDAEMAQGLPPYAQTMVYRAAEYEGIPESWMSDSDNEATYFFPVRENGGMWLDFNMNSGYRLNGQPYDVAILISVQGVNSITGQPTKGNFQLEQYRTKCPVHNVKLTANGYCADCRYSWPPQNYLAASAQGGRTWLDGFMDKDGIVRQWVFTSDVMRGVAANIIGKQRVIVIAMAFYISAQPKPRPADVYRGGHGDDEMLELGFHHEPVTRGLHETMRYDFDSPVKGAGAKRRAITPKSLEVAAGARINQRIEKDTNPIDYWETKPRGFLYAYYVTEEDLKAILATKIGGNGEGWLSTTRVPVGNQPVKGPF